MNENGEFESREELDAWWIETVSIETRECCDGMAMSSPLRLPRYPYWDKALCAELLAWSRLWTEVLEMHNEFLRRSKERATRHGREWDREEFLRQERLREAGE